MGPWMTGALVNSRAGITAYLGLEGRKRQIEKSFRDVMTRHPRAITWMVRCRTSMAAETNEVAPWLAFPHYRLCLATQLTGAVHLVLILCLVDFLLWNEAL